MKPKVSVCIPTYNTGHYLAQAIDSVLAQDFTDYELLICDNASTDATPEVLRGYTDPRIRYVRYEELVNQGANWNRCVKLAQGDYVALLHADDVYLPGFLSARVRALDGHSEVGLVFSAVRLIDEAGNEIGTQSFSELGFVAEAPEFLKELLFGCVISPVSPMVRRSCYEANGLFIEGRTWGIDWEMWLRLSARYAVEYLPEVTASYRVHSASGTADVLLQAKSATEDFETLQDIFREVERRPELHRFASLRRPTFHRLALRTLYAAGYNCERGNADGVRQNLRFALSVERSLVFRPTIWALWLSCYFGRWVYRAFRQLRPV